MKEGRKRRGVVGWRETQLVSKSGETKKTFSGKRKCSFFLSFPLFFRSKHLLRCRYFSPGNTWEDVSAIKKSNAVPRKTLHISRRNHKDIFSFYGWRMHGGGGRTNLFWCQMWSPTTQQGGQKLLFFPDWRRFRLPGRRIIKHIKMHEWRENKPRRISVQ